MNYKAIIFDMDGTIIHTEHIWQRATKELITSRGIEFTPTMEHDLALQLAGLSLRESCSIIKQTANIADPLEQLMQEKSKLANEAYEMGICFIDGFIPFHEQAAACNLKMGVATNANDQTVLITNRKLNLEHYFGQHIYNISKVNNVGKPHPAIYLHAAEQLQVSPKECIAIEDSAHGIQAAKAAGMFCIGINTAKKPSLLKNADLIIDGYHEIDLPTLLGS